jgi:tRNA (guanine37-N1)-methyltransferase
MAAVTLFADMFTAVTTLGVTGRAFSRGLVELRCINPRDYTTDVHRTVDDRPYGGGPGMVMLAEPLLNAIAAASDWVAGSRQIQNDPMLEDAPRPWVVYLSPQGQPLTQARVQQLAQRQALVLVAGRYEGIDERVLDLAVDEQISVGDYVVSGGELPAMLLMDAIIRLLPGALGHENSAEEDSFTGGVLDCPHYTRPEVVRGLPVPPVLLSGNHALIRRWRRRQALIRTRDRRPDLFDKVNLNKLDLALLQDSE